jgi:hypothetical protein
VLAEWEDMCRLLAFADIVKTILPVYVRTASARLRKQPRYPQFCDCLQPQLPRAVLSEQAAISYVSSYHLNRAMPSLIHDRTLRSSRDCRASSMASTKRVPGILSRIQARPLCQLLYDACHVNAG